jgi:probable phosphoglycerate mutase
MTGNLFDETNAPIAWFTAHCDGGSRGNPGPSGYGAVIQDPQGQIVARLSKFLGVQTNNYAEYSGLLAVLEWALQNDAGRLRVVSDSELMVNQMKGRYKVASPVLKPLWEEAKRRADKLERFEISHTLRGGNKEADRLANEAMDNRWKAVGQQVSGAASQQESGVSGVSGVSPVRANAYEGVSQVSLLRPGTVQTSDAPPPVLEGYVKDGVVHLVNGELPEGTRVKVTKK